MQHVATPAMRRLRPADELASCIIHGIGVLLSIAGLVWLVLAAARAGASTAVVASAVFGTTLILLYLASTIYHALPGVRGSHVLRALDHVAIFLLIAGTYTPFTLLALPPAWGWSLFGVIWGLAVLGSLLELGWLKRSRRLGVIVYIAMGWVGLIALGPLSHYLHVGGLALLLLGGLVYTLGVPFYLCRRLPFHHSVWHLFVLAGSILHFAAVLAFVLPAAAA